MMSENKKKLFRDKMLVSLQAFLPEDKEIIKIINMIDLNPVDGWRIWENDYCPTLRIQKNKQLIVGQRKFSDYYSNKDVFAFSTAAEIAKISKSILLIENDKSSFANITYNLLFWGQDNKLRLRQTYCDKNNNYIWSSVFICNPLIININDIRIFIQQEHTKTYVEVNLYKNKKSKGLIISWPPTEQTINELKKEKLWNYPVESLL